MDKYAFKLIVFGLPTVCLFLLPIVVFAIETEKEETICESIGFAPKTPKFAECVLELVRRNSSVKENNAIKEKAIKNDRTPDHHTCANYGFSVGTVDYANCRMNIDLARKQLLQRQNELVQHQEQIKNAEAQNRREESSLLLIEMGANISAGRSPFVGPSAPSNATQVSEPPPGGFSTCVYSLNGGEAKHTIRTGVCPITMKFGGVVGYLKRAER